MARLTIYCLIGFVLANCPAQQATAWQVFQVADGITVKLPGTPKTPDSPNDPNTDSRQTWLLQSDGDYILRVSTLKESSNSDRREWLNSFVEGLVRVVPDGLIEENSTIDRGWPGVNVLTEQSKIRTAIRASIVGNKLICLGFRYRGGGPVPETGQLFLNSLKIAAAIPDGPAGVSPAYRRYPVGNTGLIAVLPTAPEPIKTSNPSIKSFQSLDHLSSFVIACGPTHSGPVGNNKTIADGEMDMIQAYASKVDELKISQTQFGGAYALHGVGRMPNGLQCTLLCFVHNGAQYCVASFIPKNKGDAAKSAAFFKSLTFGP